MNSGAAILALLERVSRILEGQYREYLRREGVNRQRREAIEQEMTVLAHLMDEARSLP